MIFFSLLKMKKEPQELQHCLWVYILDLFVEAVLLSIGFSLYKKTLFTKKRDWETVFRVVF